MLSVHSRLERSRANGPGIRAVIRHQGSRRNCPGCFNPQPQDGRNLASACELVRWLRVECARVEGLTISGGEPMEQAAGAVVR
jgi:anaerobic ribonucleoside-triphosphate reductase activating protein